METLNKRQRSIVSLLMENDEMSVSDLSGTLSVTSATIRSDLEKLAARGMLVKVRGGAIKSIRPDILARQKINVEQKKRIAKSAASFVNDGDTIMIEAGTTAALIPRFLSGKRGVRLVTNSVMAFNAARGCRGVELIMAGGQYSEETDSFVGFMAAEMVKKFNAQYAFVGTDGFSVRAGITAHTVGAAQIARVMREKSEKLAVVSDSSKYNEVGAVNILSLSSIDMLITDTALPSAAEAELSNSGCEVVFC